MHFPTWTENEFIKKWYFRSGSSSLVHENEAFSHFEELIMCLINGKVNKLMMLPLMENIPLSFLPQNMMSIIIFFLFKFQ